MPINGKALEELQRIAAKNWCLGVEFAYELGFVDADDIERAWRLGVDVLQMKGLVPASALAAVQ